MSNSFYIISTNSTIKNVSKFLDYDFYEKELKTNNGTLKDHISDLDINAIYYGKKCIKCTIPTLFVEIEYKDLNKDTYFIDYDICLYEQHPTLKDLENYKSKFDFNFASQVEPEVYEIVESFHQGYGCMCLSSEGY
tara:strand:- start:4841 stop:5248 length:408 start_codon:yes stop_codon:yes gene_type:complete